MQGRKPKFSNSLILDNIYIDELHKQKKRITGTPRDSFLLIDDIIFFLQLYFISQGNLDTSIFIAEIFVCLG